MVVVTLLATRETFTSLLHFAFRQEHYSHIVLIPLVSGVLIYLERRSIFSRLATHWPLSLGLLATGALVSVIGFQYRTSMTENDRLASAVLPVVIVMIGAFVLTYGLRATREALFPLLFLLLMVPIPDVLLSRIVHWLQIGSAEVTDALFQSLGVPVFRTDLVFALPGVTIEIAEECSGIRSSIALLITSLLAGHLFLRSVWGKAALTVATLPLLVIKNGIRIVTLSLLAVHVDPSFLSGPVHRQGGVVFLLLTLAILLPVLVGLRTLERAPPARRAAFAGGQEAEKNLAGLR
jgi:exosortase